MRDSVVKFATKMEEALSLKDLVNGGDSWRGVSYEFLINKMYIQLDKFEAALYRKDYKTAKKHLIHAVNFAMMAESNMDG